MRIILGVTGCIGAYKGAVLLRLLQRAGFEVHPVLTRKAQEFITALTFEKLSGNRVAGGSFGGQSAQIEHISLARQSDLLLVAPATANVLGKFAAGIADDFLTTLYLSTTTPVIIAPAMNVEMWQHAAVRDNLETLKKRGNVIVDPGSGYLACGEDGEGRLAEPEKIVEEVLGYFRPRKSLVGKRVLISAGPTIEDIDSVRFISNRSSGKMGYAMALEAKERGAAVTLVTGPSQVEPPLGAEVVRVRSAEDMAQAVFERFPEVDVAVMAAAVSDFAAQKTALEKIKKQGAETLIHLRETTDILKELGHRKEAQLLVGFAAESSDLRQNALRKLKDKRLDLVVGNDISESGSGFQSDRNRVIVIDSNGDEEEFPLLPKERVAVLLWDRIEAGLNVRKQELTR